MCRRSTVRTRGKVLQLVPRVQSLAPKAPWQGPGIRGRGCAWASVGLQLWPGVRTSLGARVRILGVGRRQDVGQRQRREVVGPDVPTTNMVTQPAAAPRYLGFNPNGPKVAAVTSSRQGCGCGIRDHAEAAARNFLCTGPAGRGPWVDPHVVAPAKRRSQSGAAPVMDFAP